MSSRPEVNTVSFRLIDSLTKGIVARYTKLVDRNDHKNSATFSIPEDLTETGPTTVQRHIIELLGDTPEQIAYSCMYYDALVLQALWLRRQVETIEFESDRTLKRKLTLDIDYDVVNETRQKYGQRGSKCFLPAIERVDRQPLLTIDLLDTGNSRVTVARRHENAILGAALLAGSVIRELRIDPSIVSVEWNWVIEMIELLVEIETKIDLPSGSKSSKSARELTVSWPSSWPSDVLKVLETSDFKEAYDRYCSTYTLFAVVPCIIPHSNIEPRKRTHSITEQTHIGTIKIVRYDHVSRIDKHNGYPETGFNRHHLSPTTGTEYLVTAPLLGKERRGRHLRFICPKGMVLDSVRLYSDKEPYKIVRLPDGLNSSKYWSVHRGSYSDALKAAGLPSNGNSADHVALELLYNKKRAEIHDMGLPSASREWDPNDPSLTGLWKVRLNFSSDRSRFLVPAVGLLICTIYALSVNILHISHTTGNVSFSISSVSTLSLPLLLGFLVVGEEHLILSRALAGLRGAIGLATFLSVITACTLSVIKADVLTGEGKLKIAVWSLFWITLAVSIGTICLVVFHIQRIQRYRTDAFEYMRYFEDWMRNRIEEERESWRVWRTPRIFGVRCRLLFSDKRTQWIFAWLNVRWQMLPGVMRFILKPIWKLILRPMGRLANSTEVFSSEAFVECEDDQGCGGDGGDDCGAEGDVS